MNSHLKEARTQAEQIFSQSTNAPVLTTAGKEYKKEPQFRYLVDVEGVLVLTHRVPIGPKDRVTGRVKEYKALCRIDNYSRKGLKPKAWDILIDAILERTET